MRSIAFVVDLVSGYNNLCGHLRSVRNNNVDKPTGRHFNSINHSISDMKVCTISTISGGNDKRKMQKKRLIHPYEINERISFI